MLHLEYYILWLRDLNTRKTGVKEFGELRKMVFEENGEKKLPEKVTNEEVLQCIIEKRALLNNILHRNRIGLDIF